MNLRFAVLALALIAPLSAHAEPFASDWAPSSKSEARLIGDGAGQAGIEIRLSPGSITYWRDPGDSGVPPTFDFSGSVNLGRADVGFPEPKRIAEPDGSEAFGYDQAVVFPIHVQPVDPARPVTLALKMNYAVCEKICLPARATLTLAVPQGVSTPFADTIRDARAAAPKVVDWTATGGEITNVDAKDWKLCVPASPGAPRDMFLEAPSGFWLTTKAGAGGAGRDCFAIALSEAPTGAVPPIEVTATITGGAGAVETRLTLRAGG